MARATVSENKAITKKLMADCIDNAFRQVHLTLQHYCYHSDEVQKLMFDLGGMCTETLVKFDKNFVGNDKDQKTELQA